MEANLRQQDVAIPGTKCPKGTRMPLNLSLRRNNERLFDRAIRNLVSHDFA
jgi:hypothetical protein